MDKTDIIKIKRLYKKLANEYDLSVDEIKEIVNFNIKNNFILTNVYLYYNIN